MKNLLELGTALTKAEQKSINGGKGGCNIQCTWILNPVTCKCIPRDGDATF